MGCHTVTLLAFPLLLSGPGHNCPSAVSPDPSGPSEDRMAPRDTWKGVGGGCVMSEGTGGRCKGMVSAQQQFHRAPQGPQRLRSPPGTPGRFWVAVLWVRERAAGHGQRARVCIPAPGFMPLECNRLNQLCISKSPHLHRQKHGPPLPAVHTRTSGALWPNHA